MFFDVADFYDLDSCFYKEYPTGVTLYHIWLISKSTGEVIELTFSEEKFDELLKQMRGNIMVKELQLNYIKKGIIT